MLVKLVEVHGVILEDQIGRGLWDDAVKQGGDVGVLEFLEDFELPWGDVIQGCVFEGDNLHGEGALWLLADGFVDTAVGALADLLDQFEGRHLPTIYNTLE